MFYSYLIDNYLTNVKISFFIINGLTVDMHDCLCWETVILTHTVYLKISVFYQVNFSIEHKNYYHYNKYYN